jgi:hypothetical protein
VHGPKWDKARLATLPPPASAAGEASERRCPASAEWHGSARRRNAARRCAACVGTQRAEHGWARAGGEPLRAAACDGVAAVRVVRLGASSMAAVGEGEEKSAGGSPTGAAPSSGAGAGQRARWSVRGRACLGAWRRRGVVADAAACGGGAMWRGGVVA